MTHPERDLAPYLPLSPKDFHLLFALGEGPCHGYAIVRRVEADTNGLIRLEPANLYRRIHGFVEQGIIEPTERPPDDEDTRRRYYGLTDLGEHILNAEAARLGALAAEVARRGLAASG